MKFVIVIPDGAADAPQDSLGGRTPFQAAATPALDALAARGRIGLTNHVPDGLPPGSEVACMSLMGYDPLAYFTGRAPLEAAAQGIALGQQQGNTTLGVENALALHLGRMRGQHRREVTSLQQLRDRHRTDRGATQALQCHRQAALGLDASPRILGTASNLIAVFGQIGQMAEIGECANDTNGFLSA